VLKRGTFKEDNKLVVMEAFITDNPSIAIECQEARGQSAFVNSTTLPIESYNDRKQFEQIGIEYEEDVDDLFVSVILPDGWKKEATNRSMHSELLDEKGRKRASIFYKAAFYDRNAHINLACRFSTSVVPVCGYDDPDYQKSSWHWLVFDCGKVIHTSPDQLEPRPGQDAERTVWTEWYDRKGEFKKLGVSWLLAHYPDWKNPLAYWD